MMSEIEEREEWTKQRDILFSKEFGQTMWSWLRRRTSKLMECENPGLEGIGSSDVSCRLYELWREQYRLTGIGTITDSLGFQINCRVMDYMGYYD
tara:strand:+ start:405 stop:689 length:285 start_codon:yes stop_codon:yes gene_type:complete